LADAKGIRAGRAFVELFAGESKLVRGLRAAEKGLKASGRRACVAEGLAQAPNVR
jgi:hypothetical protein